MKKLIPSYRAVSFKIKLIFYEASHRGVLRQFWDTSEGLKTLFCLTFGLFNWSSHFYCLFIYYKEFAVSNLVKIYQRIFSYLYYSCRRLKAKFEPGWQTFSFLFWLRKVSWGPISSSLFFSFNKMCYRSDMNNSVLFS